MINAKVSKRRRIPHEPKKLQLKVGNPWVDRVYDRKSVPGFLPFEPFEFGISWNLHQPKGVPTSDFSSTQVFRGYPPLTFHQPKGYLGVPTSDFSKKCQIQMVQNAKNMVHSFYHILYQPKGVPTSIDNFSGSGGKYLLMTF